MVAPETDATPYAVKTHHHPGCFALPRKYTLASSKLTVAEFVDTILEDATEQQDILPAKADELVDVMVASMAAKKDAKKAGAAKDSPLDLIKEAFLARQKEQNGEAHEPSPKKAKVNVTTTEPNGADSRAVDAYATFQRYKNDQIKDILKWNRQHVSGTKNVLLQRVLDGAVYGRLVRCPLDGGRLKLSDDGAMVTCGGSFDESTMTRLDCAFKKPAAEVPRGEWCVALRWFVFLCAATCVLVCVCVCWLVWCVFLPRLHCAGTGFDPGCCLGDLYTSADQSNGLLLLRHALSCHCTLCQSRMHPAICRCRQRVV